MSLIKCPECGKEISESADMCINCGYPLRKFLEENQSSDICKMCGTQNENDAMYCKNCGTRIREYKTMSSTTQHNTAAAQPKPESWKIGLTVICCIVYPFTLFGLIMMWLWEIPLKRDKRIFFTILTVIWGILSGLQVLME